MNVIFDVSDLRNYIKDHDNVTGIQRVVMKALDSIPKEIMRNDVWLGFYDELNSDYFCTMFTEDYFNYHDKIGYLKNTLVISDNVQQGKMISKYKRKTFKKVYHINRLDFMARIGLSKQFKKLGITPEEWLKFRARQKLVNKLKRLHELVQKDDKIIILDNIINHEKKFEFFRDVARKDVKVITFIHDLIPIFYPQFSPGDNPKKLYDSLKKSTEFTTLFLTNSRNTKKDMDLFLQSQQSSIPTIAVPLAQAGLVSLGNSTSKKKNDGVNLLSCFMSTTEVSSEVRRVIKTGFVLVVGTREVRKNLWRLSLAWQQVIEDIGSDIKMVIVGRQGWLNDDFDSLMDGTGYLGGSIEVIEKATDYELSWLYDHCLFTVSVSMYEGWGLPIGESLGHGKTAVVSNSSAMPEVGKDLVEYCDPCDIESIKKSCLRLLTDDALRNLLEDKIANAKLRSWQEFGVDLNSAIQSI